MSTSQSDSQSEDDDTGSSEDEILFQFGSEPKDESDKAENDEIPAS